ncbi:hypothetical protein RhiJN_01896 [Ceratobasidium sp. AG-Ba]|nr:hypothetical protein RhiJN_01896 [Ceratobasidium sp. AG-Ba]
MPRGLFNSDERTFLLGSYQTWVDLCGSSKIRNSDGELLNPKDQHIDTVIFKFFQMYPHRDLEAQPDSSTAFTISQRDTIHTRIKQLYYNEAAKTQDTDHAYTRSQFNKYISVLSLFKQRYSKAILARRDQLATSRSLAHLLSVYNTAVKLEFDQFQAQNPAGYVRLEEEVDKIEISAKSKYEDLDPQTQQILLDVVPGFIGNTVCDISRQTGVHFRASKNCGKWVQSTGCKKVRNMWEDWLYESPTKKNPDTGHTIALPDSAPSLVPYPDNNGWPMLPDLDLLRLSQKQERRILRRYFTLLSLAYGGDQPSYSQIEKRMTQEPGSYIELRRMPESISILTDLNKWVKTVTNSWIAHLLAGQRGELEWPFRWRILPQAGGRDEVIVTESRTSPVNPGRMGWKSEERLYALWLQSNFQPPQVLEDIYQNLPLARTKHIYCPYTTELYEKLSAIHAEQPKMLEVLHLVALYKHYGPIHNERTIAALHNIESPHLCKSPTKSLSRNLVPAGWLPALFFDSHAQGHENSSVSFFLQLLRVVRPHIGQVTGTAFGGPIGTRACVFFLSRIIQNLEMAQDRSSLPAELAALAGQPGWLNYLETQMQHALDALHTIRLDLESSIEKLELSLHRRTQAWKSAILAREALAAPGSMGDCNMTDHRASATSGVPNSWQIILEMAAALKLEHHAGIAPGVSNVKHPTADSAQGQCKSSESRTNKSKESAEYIDLRLSNEGSTDDELEEEQVETISYMRDSVEHNLQPLTDAPLVAAEPERPHTLDDSAQAESSGGSKVPSELNNQPNRDAAEDNISLERRRSRRQSIKRPGYDKAIKGSRKGTYKRS